MISVETINPVRYSNTTGDADKKARRKARRSKITESGQKVLQKADESGILSGVKNLLLGSSQTPSQTEYVAPAPAPVDNTKPPMNKALKYTLIGAGVLVAGIIIWKVTKKKSN
jgi:hypothetical protein